jgi:cytochrome c-type biogenesis protein
VIIVCVIAIVFGLNLLGFNLLKLFKIDLETKPLVQKLAKKYVFTYAGLFVLGFLFYFLDPCIAPVFISMMSLLVIEYLPLILFVFALGVIVPFVCIAILAGSISKLVRGTYKHKAKIRAISGLILIIYGLYFVFQYVHAFLF